MDQKINGIPFVSWEQMKEVDRVLKEELGMAPSLIAENSGRALALKARELLVDMRLPRVAVFAGAGANGSGAIVAARWLVSWGYNVDLYLAAEPEDYEGFSGQQLQMLRTLKVPTTRWCSLYLSREYELVLDGVIGYSLKGAPRGVPKDMIVYMNQQKVPVISLDIPSGIDPDEGIIYPFYVKADYTVALGLPKKSFLEESVQTALGEVFLADISIPPQVFTQIGIKVPPLFKEKEIIHLLRKTGSQTP